MKLLPVPFASTERVLCCPLSVISAREHLEQRRREELRLGIRLQAGIILKAKFHRIEPGITRVNDFHRVEHVRRRQTDPNQKKKRHQRTEERVAPRPRTSRSWAVLRRNLFTILIGPAKIQHKFK